jgi:hypothetical protein
VCRPPASTAGRWATPGQLGHPAISTRPLTGRYALAAHLIQPSEAANSERGVFLDTLFDRVCAPAEKVAVSALAILLFENLSPAASPHFSPR